MLWVQLWSHCLFPLNHVNDCSWKFSTSTNPGPLLKARDGGWHDQIRSTHWKLRAFLELCKICTSEPLGLLKWYHHHEPSFTLPKIWLQHVWIPSRKTENKKKLIFNKHITFCYFVSSLDTFWACDFLKSKPPHLWCDASGSELSSAHTVVRFRCPQHSWPNETRWGPWGVGVIGLLKTHGFVQSRKLSLKTDGFQ